MPVSVGGYTREVGFFEAPLADGARALLVECPDLYDREALYAIGGEDYPDNARRFAVLVRAALEFAARRGQRPSVVHAHDWQAGLAPVYLKHALRVAPGARRRAVASSRFTTSRIRACSSPTGCRASICGGDELGVDRLEFWGRISFLKGGINARDVITTVSRRYAEEIQTPEFGFGFDGILRAAARPTWSAS